MSTGRPGANRYGEAFAKMGARRIRLALGWHCICSTRFGELFEISNACGPNSSRRMSYVELDVMAVYRSAYLMMTP